MVQRADAVFEGGGVKGIGFVGALQAFEEADFQWHNLAGTSAGSITAALAAVGYTGSELREVMRNRVDFSSFTDTTGIGKVPVVGPWLSAIFHTGMYQGDAFLNLMCRLLAEKVGKEKVTFRDLIMPKEPGDSQEDYERRYKYKLQVIAADLSGTQMLVLPQDIAKLGADPDDLEVALAVRMSMSIPFFFRPVIFGERGYRRDKHWIVDGGLLSSFPIWLFDAPAGEAPPWPTIGFLLWEPGAGVPRNQKIRGLVSMTVALGLTMNRAFDRKALEETDLSRIVKIPTGPVESTDFDLGDEDREWLANSGYQAGKKFLETWDFDAYVTQRIQGLPDA